MGHLPFVQGGTPCDCVAVVIYKNSSSIRSGDCVEKRKKSGGVSFFRWENPVKKRGENLDKSDGLNKSVFRLFFFVFFVSAPSIILSYFPRKCKQKARNDEKNRKKMDDPQNPHHRQSQVVEKQSQGFPVSGKRIRKLSRKLSTKGKSKD